MPVSASRKSVRPLASCEPTGPAVRSGRVNEGHSAPNGQLMLDLSSGNSGHTAAAGHGDDITRRLEPARLRGLLTALIEVHTGHRPAWQIHRLLHPRLYAVMINRVCRPNNRYSLKSVHACHPAEGVCEASGRVQTGQRSLGLAARFEIVNQAWLCTRFELIGQERLAIRRSIGNRSAR